MKYSKLLSAIVLSTLFMSSPAYAYLDPGTGSMLLQALIASVTGAFVVGGIYWAKVKAFFKRSQPEKEDGGANSLD